MANKPKYGHTIDYADYAYYLDYRQIDDGLVGHGIVIYQAINKDAGVAYFESPDIGTVARFISNNGRTDLNVHPRR